MLSRDFHVTAGPWTQARGYREADCSRAKKQARLAWKTGLTGF